MPETFLNFVGPFEITELTGPKRTLRLSARALPYKPYTLVGSQRVEMTWYPGNPEATAQVLGAKEEPVSIRGTWKDRFLSELPSGLVDDDAPAPATLDDAPLTTATQLVETVDEMRRAGQLVEVTWLRTVRRGFITRFTQTWLTVHDCEWELEFSWVSQDVGEFGVVDAEVDLSSVVVDAQNDSQDLSNELGAAQSSSLADPSLGGVADAVTSSLEKFQASVRSLEDTMTGMLDAVLAPLDAGRRVLSITQFLAQEANNVIDTLYSRTFESMAGVSDPATGTVDYSQVTFGKSVVAASARSRMVVSARTARGHAARHGALVARQVDSDLDRAFLATQDMDLRDVSRQFFGTSDEWQRIARFNGLTSSHLVAGQQILVPRNLPAGEAC